MDEGTESDNQFVDAREEAEADQSLISQSSAKESSNGEAVVEVLQANQL